MSSQNSPDLRMVNNEILHKQLTSFMIKMISFNIPRNAEIVCHCCYPAWATKRLLKMIMSLQQEI